MFVLDDVSRQWNVIRIYHIGGIVVAPPATIASSRKFVEKLRKPTVYDSRNDGLLFGVTHPSLRI